MQAPAESLAGACTAQPTHPLETYCALGEERGLDLTRLRLQVLTALWQSNIPMGAYGIADQLTRPSSRAYANSIYRTLHTLADVGLVVPIISWRRFLISPDPRQRRWTFNLCENCRSCEAAPVDVLALQIRSLCAERGFAANSIHIECLGFCRECERRK